MSKGRKVAGRSQLTLEEGDQRDETTLVTVSGPLGNDESVVGLSEGVVLVGVKHDDLAEVSVEVFEVLDRNSSTALREIESSRISVQSVGHVGAIGVELFGDGRGVHGGLVGEEDDLVELREVGDKVVGSRSLGGTPTVLTVPLGAREDTLEVDEEGVGSNGGDWGRKQLGPGRLGEVLYLYTDEYGRKDVSLVHQAEQRQELDVRNSC